MSKISPFSNVSLGRVAAVTGSLALLGAIAGAVVGLVVLAGLGLALEGSLLGVRDLAIGAGVGALCGAVFGPLVSWTLLRSVPIGRAVIETSVGAAIGAAIAATARVPSFLALLGIALAGAVAAAIRLRFAAGRASKSAGDGSAGSSPS